MIRDRIQDAFDATGADSLNDEALDEAIKAGFRDFIASPDVRDFTTDFALVHNLLGNGPTTTAISGEMTVKNTDGQRFKITITVNCEGIPANG